MRILAGGLLVLVACAFMPRAVDAGVTCGRTVVLPGASAREVLEKCGAPTRRQAMDGKPKRGRGKAGGGSGREVWVYDLGPRQLVRYLTFDRGRLRAIEFGGYGR